MRNFSILLILLWLIAACSSPPPPRLKERKANRLEITLSRLPKDFENVEYLTRPPCRLYGVVLAYPGGKKITLHFDEEVRNPKCQFTLEQLKEVGVSKTESQEPPQLRPRSPRPGW